MKITKRQLRKIIRESVRLLNEEESRRVLNEEEYDYYRDYKAGLISREQYEKLVDRFGGGRGPDGNRDKLRPSDFAVTIHKAPRIDAARKAIEAAMKADGLTDSWRDYSEMRKFLDKGYKDHPDYERHWDTAASELLRRLERSID